MSAAAVIHYFPPERLKFKLLTRSKTGVNQSGTLRVSVLSNLLDIIEKIGQPHLQNTVFLLSVKASDYVFVSDSAQLQKHHKSCGIISPLHYSTGRVDVDIKT